MGLATPSLLCTVAFLVGCAAAPAAMRPGPAPPPPAAGRGPFVLVGYVVDRSVCPPCPPAAQCEPCEPSIIVSDRRDPPDRRMLADGNLRVLVPSAQTFALGAQVKLRVEAIPEQPFQNDPCCSRVGPYVVRLLETLLQGTAEPAPAAP